MIDVVAKYSDSKSLGESECQSMKTQYAKSSEFPETPKSNIVMFLNQSKFTRQLKLEKMSL